MKKFLALLLTLTMFIPTVAFGEGLGVQLISGPQTETEPVDLDDIKLDIDVEIPGYAIITPRFFSFLDSFLYYRGSSWDPRTTYSGAEADYAMLFIDILNTGKKEKEYIGASSVVVIFDDDYVYGGWVAQIYYDEINNVNREFSNKVIDTDGSRAIDPMYLGHYVFGCALPNAVVNSKKPLRMVITIDGNKITYNIRK